MPKPLLAVDAPSLLYRAFHALPSSITDGSGRPVNALLGTANLVLFALERHQPRAVVLCFGAEAARYRKELFAPYHADRPPMPEDLVEQWKDAPAFFAAFGWPSLDAGDLEADDLLGSLARAETSSGGRALLFTGDRDMFQCAGDGVTVLYPRTGAKDGPDEVDATGVRERYGVDPTQVPDFIALRGDPSDGLPGAKGIGEKTARDLLREHRDLEGVLAAAARPGTLRPRVRATLSEAAQELRAFRAIATLQPVEIPRPADAPLDGAGAARAARERGMERLATRLEGL